MIEAKIPDNEDQRLAALRSYDILDSDPDRAFDDLTQIAAQLCGTPISLVSLVDAERQWFKSKVGLDATETPRRVAYCAHAILEPEQILVVPDAHEDERFFDNPLATGEPFVRFYAGAPLVNPEGMPLGTLCVIDHKPRELSEDKQAALRVLARQVVSQLELTRRALELRTLTQHLQRSNEELRDFTSVAAHDLREPLRKVVTFGDLLRQDLGDDLPEQAGQDLSYMLDATHRMEHLVDALLELARAGSREIERRPVDLSECVQRAQDALAVRIDESGADIVVGSLPVVQGDVTLLTQLLQNLIGNAVKFVRDRTPEVAISGATTDRGVEVVVQDNGIGIDRKHAEQIFRPFRRLHGQNRFEGTGIGLAIVRKVIDRHGGRIWVESTPGEGSRFHFFLPADAVGAPLAQ